MILKELGWLLLLLVTPAVYSVEFSINLQEPWKPEGKNAYRIEFRRNKETSRIWIMPKKLESCSYYRLSFESADGGLLFAALIRERLNGRLLHYGYRDDLESPGGPKKYSFYFRPKDSNAVFAVYPLQEKEGRCVVRNIRLEKVTDFCRNLLVEGDFEFGSALLPRHKRFEKQLVVVESPSFFAGEKSLRLEKKAGDFSAVITRDIPAIPGRTAEIRFWAKSQKGMVPCVMYFDFFRSGYKKHLVRRFGFKAEPEWKEFTFSCAIPSDTAEWPALTEGMARIQFHLLKSATEAAVYFDNLEYRLK